MKKIIILIYLLLSPLLLSQVEIDVDYLKLYISSQSINSIDSLKEVSISNLNNNPNSKFVIHCIGLNFEDTNYLFEKLEPLNKQKMHLICEDMAFESLPKILSHFSQIKSLTLTDCKINSISSIKTEIDTIIINLKFKKTFNIPYGISKSGKNINIELNFEHFRLASDSISINILDEFYESNNLVSFILFLAPKMQFPDFIFSNLNLNKLFLFGCKFDYIPDKFDKLMNLKDLLIYGNTLNSNCYPVSLIKLMKKLDIHYPKFETCTE